MEKVRRRGGIRRDIKASVEGEYVKTVAISATMGPGIRIDHTTIK